jgi:ADP-heptose:LPS heptosyltransferase
MTRSKAFFLNGGAGRMLCSIPALELYAEESGDTDFIIVCEGGTDMFKGHPLLHKRAYDPWHKNLFETEIKHRQVVNPEPYQVWEYYNQECNLSQAFDIILNNKGVRQLPKPLLKLSKDELLVGRKLLNEIKEKIKKEKVLVVQPFGRGIEVIDDTPVDVTARSFEFKDLKQMLKKLEKDYAIVMMSEMKIELKGEGLKNEVAMPEGLNLRQWSALIKMADHFLGCDSVGQHLAYAVGTKTTAVIGSTFPVNVSYPNDSDLKIVDLGMTERVYDPIRITQDETVNRHNENIMAMDDAIQDYVISVVKGDIDPDSEE